VKGLKTTDFNFPGQLKVYNGKVRDVYHLKEKLVIVASDRISAFDHILPKPIPYKGQILTQLAQYFLNATRDIVPNWLEANPHPNVSIGKKAEPIMLEMVVRGYLAGHAWREYKSGKRMICGVQMPEGMREGDRFPSPIITPATKAVSGHDEDISAEEILSQGIVSQTDWNKLSIYALQLFQRGTQMAAEQGLILVDTKYEFGRYQDDIILIDEIHTPDSSRYYISEGYEHRQRSGEKQKQLSKEFVREWLMSNGFQGLEGQTMPQMPEAFIASVTDRYEELYTKLTGQKLEKLSYEGIHQSIQDHVVNYLQKS
jgi:phosphoribosylaminoimidazole-succinocarboxamide synthase